MVGDETSPYPVQVLAPWGGYVEAIDWLGFHMAPSPLLLEGVRSPWARLERDGLL